MTVYWLVWCRMFGTSFVARGHSCWPGRDTRQRQCGCCSISNGLRDSKILVSQAFIPLYLLPCTHVQWGLLYLIYVSVCLSEAHFIYTWWNMQSSIVGTFLSMCKHTASEKICMCIRSPIISAFLTPCVYYSILQGLLTKSFQIYMFPSSFIPNLNYHIHTVNDQLMLLDPFIILMC